MLPIIGSLISGIGSLASAGLNLWSQHQTNQMNKELAQEANDITKQNNQFMQNAYLDEQQYNRNLQERLFEREDNSYQRTVNDITKSGLSPLAINGTNDSGSVVGQAQMPELSNINPFQAESLNFGQLADIIGQADSRRLQERALDIEEQKNLSDKEQKEADRKEQIREFDAKQEQNKKQFDTQMNQVIEQAKISNEREAKKLEIEQQKLTNILNNSKLAEDKQHAEQAERELRAMTGGRGSTKRYTNKSEYESAISSWREQFSSQLLEYSKSLTQATSKSNSNSASGGVGAAALLSAEASSSKSESESWSNLDESARAKLNSWLANNPMPVYY